MTVESFEVGARVKIAGVSKGKGFQGTIKRHNFNSGPKSHGSHNVRAPGLDRRLGDARRASFKGIRGPGQMGNKRATQRGLEIVAVDAERRTCCSSAARCPARRGGVVEVRSDA